MSTSPDRLTSRRPADVLVTAISEWLAGHSSDERLETELAGADLGTLEVEQREAVEELLEGLRDEGARRAEVNMVARETLQALVF
jgi:hypothetical protein